MVKYLDTDPWLTFRLDLGAAGLRLWISMGLAQAKIDQLRLAPLKPTVAEELHSLYLAKGVHATTAIEGNSLSEEQTRGVLAGTLKLPKSRAYLEEELRNVVRGIEAVAEGIAESERFVVTPRLIGDLNRLVLAGLELDPDVVPGEVRTHSVMVGRYRGAPAEDCDELLSRLCDWLNGPDFAPVEDDAVTSFVRVICRAVAAHLYMAWIQPFGDGNGRVARLLEFGILLASGFPSPACHLLTTTTSPGPTTTASWISRAPRVAM